MQRYQDSEAAFSSYAVRHREQLLYQWQEPYTKICSNACFPSFGLPLALSSSWREGGDWPTITYPILDLAQPTTGLTFLTKLSLPDRSFIYNSVNLLHWLLWLSSFGFPCVQFLQVAAEIAICSHFFICTHLVCFTFLSELPFFYISYLNHIACHPRHHKILFFLPFLLYVIPVHLLSDSRILTLFFTLLLLPL